MWALCRTLLVVIASLVSIEMKSVQAADFDCLPTFLNQLVGGEDGLGTRLFPLSFAPSKKLLFLGDGNIAKETHFMLGESLHHAYPDKIIYSTDISIKETTVHGNLTKMHLDHTDPKGFPFPDNSFDTIVMKNGLCACHNGLCCGGFDPHSPQAEKFFREVVRVLDKNQSTSRAVLQGGHKVTNSMLAHWKKVLEQIEFESQVKATLHFNSQREFIMISIQPRSFK